MPALTDEEDFGDKIWAPWSPEQVEALNKYQEEGWFHPFTCCGLGSCRDKGRGECKLIATEKGWMCPFPDCELPIQEWSWKFMAEPKPW